MNLNPNDDDAIRLDAVEGGGLPKERRDAAANRVLILETAESLFAEHGVADVTMADIAQAAEVGKGTLYRRFANKGELCLALMDTQMRDFQNRVLLSMQQMAAEDEMWLSRLDYFLDQLVHFTSAHSPLLCEVQRSGLLQDGASDQFQLPHFWQFMTVSGLLRTAVAQGELSSDLDVDYLADAILAPLKADLFRFQREVRGFSLDRISTGIRTLVRGLAAIEEV